MKAEIVTAATFGLLGSYLIYKTLCKTNLKKWFYSMLEVDCDKEIEFWYAETEELIPYSEKPTGAMEFANRCALLCEKNAVVLQDFTGEREETTCLDIGCSVGATSLELSKCFYHVRGIDKSEMMISVAEKVLERRIVEYSTVVEGDFRDKKIRRLDPNEEVEGVSFIVADPCCLPEHLAPVDCILSALLLERLPYPKEFLKEIPRLLKVDGVAVIVSAYDWVDSITHPSHQLKGARTSEEELKAFMLDQGLELKHEENLPFIRRKNARNYEWCVAHGTVWKLKRS